MNLRHEINRFEHLFHDGVEKTRNGARHSVGNGAKRAAGIARRVRDQVDVRALATTEERIVEHVRENPVLYLLGAALLISFLIAKLIGESRAAREAPLL